MGWPRIIKQVWRSRPMIEGAGVHPHRAAKLDRDALLRDRSTHRRRTMTAKNAALTWGKLFLALGLTLGATGAVLAAGYDLPGYGRLRFGMTQAQVARAYPKLKLIQTDYYDLQVPLKWAGRTWRTVAWMKGGRLAAVMVLTPHDPTHFRQVVAAARRDLGSPRVYQQKLLFWRQSQRVIVLGWTKVGGRPTTFMRFMPLKKTAAPQPPAKAPPPAPAKKPGPMPKKPASGIYRATGEYQVCSGRVPYRFCSSRFAWGTGRTEIEAQVSCSNHMARMVQILTMGGSTAYIVRNCRVIK